MPSSPGAPELQRIYGARFAGRTAYRMQIWRVLAAYLGQWFPSTGAVLDLGAGYCEFINNAAAGVKYAMDLNPDIQERAAQDVTVLQQDCTDPWPFREGELDAVFTSNFLEHLPDKAAVSVVLSNAYRCLKPGGRFIAIGPNIKYNPGAYWDFFDHYVPLTELSLAEALSNRGFKVEKVVGRFLPYTMSRGRQYPAWVLRLYLAMPAVWPIIGKQFLVIGLKPLKAPYSGPEVFLGC
jgi:SAM-dependent methyltransferase